MSAQDFPDTDRDVVNYFSSILFLAAKSRSVVLSKFTIPIRFASSPPQLRTFIVSSLRDSIDFLVDTLSMFPEDVTEKVIETLVDSLLDLLKVDDLNTFLQRLFSRGRPQIQAPVALIEVENGQS